MKTVKGIYENGEIKLLEKSELPNKGNVLVTFLEEENANDEEDVRSLSLTLPDNFLKEYLEDEREDLYQDYTEKIKK